MDDKRSKERLFSDLLEGLKGKSVYTTLKAVISGKKTNVYYTLKGLSSLFTHVCIELERGNFVYKTVLFEVFEKIQKIMKKL